MWDIASFEGTNQVHTFYEKHANSLRLALNCHLQTAPSIQHSEKYLGRLPTNLQFCGPELRKQPCFAKLRCLPNLL
jgi:hypothetical protein